MRGTDPEFLRTVAKLHKGMIISFAIFLLCFSLRSFAPTLEIRLVLSLCSALAGVLLPFFTFPLAMKIYGTSKGIFLGFLSIFFGVFIFFPLNSKVTKLLKENGKSVGLLGADLSQL